MPDGLILVIDGHDGAGKTTLARRLAEDLGARYVRPFSGTEGERMLEAAERGRFAEAARLGREMVRRASRGAGRGVQIFDRQWMTLFTLLPESFWPGWHPLPPTVMCRAGLEATLSRLEDRGQGRADIEWHVRYLDRYESIARRFRVPILRTDQAGESASLAWLRNWAAEELSSEA